MNAQTLGLRGAVVSLIIMGLTACGGANKGSDNEPSTNSPPPTRSDRQLDQIIDTAIDSSAYAAPAALSFAAIDPPPQLDTTDLVGVVSGEYGAAPSGAATYTVPLVLPPGTAGVSPKLSINYNSHSQNGLLGVGWSLSGLSTITRCNSTYAQHGYVDGVDLDGNDRFCLDGQHLFAVNGTYGADGTEYRTEINGFSRIISYGTRGNGPAYFRVWTRSGDVMEYGVSDDAKVQSQDREGILLWALNRVEDSLGNYFEVSYTTDQSNGEYYVSQMAYTGNEAMGLAPYATVDFVYEDRPDPIRSYVLGSKMQTTQRLARIETHVDHQLVKSYRLNYLTADHSSRSLLNQISECTGTNQCLLPLTFDWQQTTDPGWEDLGDSYDESKGIVDAGGVDRGQRFVDINGDGLVDRVRGEGDSHRTFLNTGSRWESNISFDPVCSFVRREGLISIPRACQLVDVNGDGLPDMVNREEIWINTSQTTWNGTDSIWVRADYDFPTRTYDNDGKSEGVVFADLNADGLVDVLRQQDGAWLNTGEGWQPANDFRSPYGFVQGDGKDLGTRVIDLNGDGLPDIMHYRTHRDGGEWKGAYLNTGSGWQQADQYTPPYKFSHTGDGRVYPGGEAFVRLNDDNLPDLVYYRDLGTKNGVRSVVRAAFINTGNGWLEAPQFESPVEIVDGYMDAGVRFLDLNGDGLDDILFGRIDRYGEPVAEAMGAYINNRNGWTAAPEYTPVDELVVIDDDAVSPDRGKRLIDLDGDGFRDFFFHRSNRYGDDPHIHRELGAYRQKAQFELITSFNTSLGISTRVDYRPLTGAESVQLYKRTNDAAHPATDLAIPLYVVAREETENGLGGTVASRYEYEGLKAHTQGRGLLGFSKVRIIDEQTQVITVTDYHQEFPLIGRPKTMNTWLPGWIISASTEWNYAVNNDSINGRIQFPYVSQKKEVNYLLHNDFTILGKTTSTTTNQYDDYGNATHVTVTISGASHDFTTSTVNTYDNYPDRWHLGRLTRTEVTKTIDGQTDANSLRTSAFSYDDATGMLISETVEPDQSPLLTLTTRYQHDGFGNVIETRTQGEGFEPRRASSIFDSRGRFPESSSNALGHTETYEHDPYFGVQTRMTGPNGLSTQTILDGLGRPVQEIRADGTHTTTHYAWCEEACPRVGEQYPYYKVITETSGAAPAITYFDGLTREIRTEMVGLDNRTVYSDIEFDQLGRQAGQSLPYFPDSETPLWSRPTYDSLGRVVSISRPDGLSAYTDFRGYLTRTWDTSGRGREELKNALGQVTRVTEALNTVNEASMRYEYDSQGQLHKTIDSAGNEIVITYDVLGRKVAMDDPDMGQWSYTYNALGELISQTDAKGQTSRLSYDALGRLVERSEAEGATRWVYNDLDAPAGSRGKLHREENDAGMAKDYTYDSLGRAVSVTETIEGKSYTTETVYDQYGRVARLIYPASPMHPAGMMVDRHYDEQGFLRRISNPYNQTLYWEAEVTNANGQLTQARMGNGTYLNREYDPALGWLLSTRTTDTLGEAIHAMSYTQDSVGNILTRTNDVTQLAETFEYDNLDRVTGVQTPLTGLGTHLDTRYAFDLLGNITFKSDMGDYTYGSHISGGAGPHAVTQVDGPEGLLTYAYDANGSMTEQRRNGEVIKTVAYTSFGKAYQMTNSLNGASVLFKYGTDQRRVVKRSGDQIIHYIGIGDQGTLFQIEQDSDKTRFRYAIYASGDKPVAEELITHSNDGSPVDMQTHYFHYDHLGSVEVITDQLGQVVDSRSFDAWGKARSGDWADSGASAFNTDSLLYRLGIGAGHSRGYTGHEQIEEVGLIHMNGRVYDPTLGRFLSADPNIQEPGSTQNYNRYTYVQNNPLKYTDPTGYFFESIWQSIVHIVIGVVFTPLCGPCSIAISAVVSGIITVGSGGSVEDGVRVAAISAAFGFAFHGVGSAFAAEFGKNIAFMSGAHVAKTLIHGALGGAFSAARGGKFSDGFISAAAAQFAAPAIKGLGPKGVEGTPIRVAAAAAVGGTVSELTGGKFANGAFTAAFAWTFNEGIEEAIRNAEETLLNVVDKISDSAKQANKGINGIENMFKGKTNEMLKFKGKVTDMFDLPYRFGNIFETHQESLSRENSAFEAKFLPLDLLPTEVTVPHPPGPLDIQGKRMKITLPESP